MIQNVDKDQTFSSGGSKANSVNANNSEKDF